MSRTAVCIPVADDPDGLLDTLTAIDAAADEPPLIVVAVDGGDDATARVAESRGALVLRLPERRGSYSARNAAIGALPDDIDVVVFTDAGCRPREGWLAAHRRALDGAAMSGGAVDVTTSSRPTPAEWVDRNRNLRQRAYVEHDGFAATCNLAVRRKVLDALTFDERLRSGGDRDFGLRARALGFELSWTPDALVEHPARRTSAAVLAKARRVGTGLATMPAATRPARLPNPRPGLSLVRIARREALRRGTWWELRVAWIDNRRARALHRAALRPSAVGLHVVVLLGSDWPALESFSTRWREVVVAWARDSRIDALTVVDHPVLRRRALLRRRLVDPAPSWLPPAQRQSVTVPVHGEPRWTDRWAWRRAAAQLRRGWPHADRGLVVAATPLSAPLLRRLRDQQTRTAFDTVDIWNLRRQFASSAARVDDGYRHGAGADVVTAVGASLADAMREAGAASPTVVANGADLDALRVPAGPPPVELPPPPFAVYVGTIGGRIDAELLDRIARELAPGIAVVAAGPAADEQSEHTLRHGVVHWLGSLAPDHLPGLLQRAACGLLPYTDTGLFSAPDSMKLLQYVAVGLPVVSTSLPGTPPGVLVARDASDFAAKVRAAVEHGAAPEVSLDVPSWDAVAARLLDLYLGPRAR